MLWLPHGLCTHAGDCRKYWEDDWRIQFHGNTLTAKVNNARLLDVDLACLLMYLNEMLLERTSSMDEESPETYALDLDISCNYGLTDDGVTGYLVPFLRRWPNCVRLKLYHTSVGDDALDGLKDWVASGHVRELHLSHLSGQVTSPAVLRLLRQIHNGGKYPYRCGSWGRSALWLRLEHNDITNPGEIVQTCQAEGLKVRVLNWTDLQYVRPGSVGKGKGKDSTPSIHLVLFLRQSQRDDGMLDSSSPADFTQLHSSKEAEIFSLLQNAHSNDAAAASHAQEQGQQLLSMLKRHGSQPSESNSEPQKMSLDEFKLWEMEAREAHELGADLKNYETFGDDVSSSWRFEDCVEANERIKRQGTEPGLGGAAAVSAGASEFPGGTEMPGVSLREIGALSAPLRDIGAAPLREMVTSSAPLREIGASLREVGSSALGSLHRSPLVETAFSSFDVGDPCDASHRQAANPDARTGAGQVSTSNSTASLTPPWHIASSADTFLQRPIGSQWLLPQRQQNGKSAASNPLSSNQDIGKSTSSSSAANPQDGSQPLDPGSLNMNLLAIRAMTGATMPAGRAAVSSFVSRCFSSSQFAERAHASAAFAPRGATQSAANAASAASQHDHSTSWHGEIASQQSSSSSGARQMRDFSAHQNCSSAPVPWGEQPPTWRNNLTLRQQHQQYQLPLSSEVPFQLDGHNPNLASNQHDLAASYAAFQLASVGTLPGVSAAVAAGQQEPGATLACPLWQRLQQQLLQDRGPANRQGAATDSGEGLTCMMCGGTFIGEVSLSDRRCSTCGACLVRL